MNAMGASLFICVLLSGPAFQGFKRYFEKQVLSMDSAAVTPSDFTVMLENYPLGGSKDIQTITTQIKDYLN